MLPAGDLHCWNSNCWNSLAEEGRLRTKTTKTNLTSVSSFKCVQIVPQSRPGSTASQNGLCGRTQRMSRSILDTGRHKVNNSR